MNPRHAIPTLQQLTHTGYQKRQDNSCAFWYPSSSSGYRLFWSVGSPRYFPRELLNVNCFSWLLWADISGLGQGSREVYKSHIALETWHKVSPLVSHGSSPADSGWGSGAVNFYSESNHAILYGERQQLVNRHIIPIVLISLNLWDADQFYFPFSFMGIRNSLHLSALCSVRTF